MVIIKFILSVVIIILVNGKYSGGCLIDLSSLGVSKVGVGVLFLNYILWNIINFFVFYILW